MWERNEGTNEEAKKAGEYGTPSLDSTFVAYYGVSVKSVSYTHLDVYKRQAASSGWNPPAAAKPEPRLIIRTLGSPDIRPTSPAEMCIRDRGWSAAMSWPGSPCPPDRLLSRGQRKIRSGQFKNDILRRSLFFLQS